MRTLDDIKPGQTIGRYEFLVPIARGGMAAVWAARLKGTRGFAKTVAIKTMLPTLSDDPLFEQMFLDEAQLAAQIHHPNVVEIMDLGEEHDVLYQVMEYVDGESLGQIMRVAAREKKRIPIEVAVRMISDACSGLHAAHELRSVDGTHLGLVHRDISPQNILITYDGVLKIVDFGVAKAAGRTASETTAGQIKGKAPYMSPEQALGKSIDRRTDVFAMGIVLYQVATGKHPFRGESDLATLHNILYKDVPSPRFVDPKFPRPLEAVINKALSREADSRYQTAAEMASALQRVFPPTQRPAEVSDVGTYLRELMGEVGEKRRKALAEAIRRADTRTSPTAPVESSGATLQPLSELAADLSSGVMAARPVAEPTQRIDKVAIPAPGDPALRASSPALEALARSSSHAAVSLQRASQVSAPSLPLPPPPSADNPLFESPPPASQPSRTDMALDPDLAPKPASRSWLLFAAIGAVIAIAGGLGAFLFVRSRPTASTQPPPTHSAPVASAPVASALAPATSEAGGPVYDIDSVSKPVVDQQHQEAAPAATVSSEPAAPATGTKPAHSAETPAASAPPVSTWKPPPVADPGF